MSGVPRLVIVVTGAGGIGLAIARRCAGGRTIVLGDISAETLNSALSSLEADGFTVVTHRYDLRESLGVFSFARFAKETGHIDAIYHTAGVTWSVPDVDVILKTNVLGTALITEHFLPSVEPGCALIVVASMYGHLEPMDPGLASHLARAAIGGLLQHLDLLDVKDGETAYKLSRRATLLRVQGAVSAWAAKGVRINSVSPTGVKTPMIQRQLKGEHRNRILHHRD